MKHGPLLGIQPTWPVASGRNPGDEPLSCAHAASTARARCDQQAGLAESAEVPAFATGLLSSAQDENAGQTGAQRNHPSPLVAALAQAVHDVHAKRAHLQGGVGGNVPTTLVQESSRLASPPPTRTGRRYQRGGVVVDVLEGTASRP
jgi:hypothetical protein